MPLRIWYKISKVIQIKAEISCWLITGWEMDKKHPTIEATRKRNDFGAVLVDTVNERIKASRELLMQSRELLDTLSMRKQENEE